MSGPVGSLDRRAFLRLSAAGAGGLLVSVSLPACRGDDPDAVPAAPPERRRLDAFLELSTDGAAEIRIPVPEIGQGVRTSLALLVAEELDVPWDRVSVVQGGTDADLGPHPFAGGSWSVRAHWTPLRTTGAVARAALVAAAAARWNVAPTDLTTEAGAVEHRDGRRLAYGDLVVDAAASVAADGPQGRRVDPATVRLKAPSEFRLLGRPTPHLDAPDLVRGAPVFGVDVRRPGMVRAVVARGPTYGARVVAWDDTACRGVPGFRTTVRIPAVGNPDRPYSAEGVAVVADDTWAAMRARDLLDVTWDPGPNVGENSADLMARARSAVEERGRTFREAGAVDDALADASRRVSAVYSAPFLAHAPMEPMNCVVAVEGEGIVVHAPTQVPEQARRLAAQIGGVDEDRVVVHVARSGGGFGRRLGVDFVLEAIPVARAVGVPVQMVWTREDDLKHGALRPLNAHRFDAGLDGAGRLTAWRHRQAGTSRYAFRDGVDVALSEFRAGTWPAALAGTHRLEYDLVPSNLPRGPLRAPGLNTFTWAVECFLDEVAAAAGVDPLQFRLQLLGAPRELPYDEDDVFDTGRMAAVLRRAADGAGWGTPLPPGRGRGIACGFTFGSYVAHVVEASVDPVRGRVAVHRIVSAIDCGFVVNPNGVRHQMEGGALDGLGAALHGAIEVESGAVTAANFDGFPLLRLPEAPPVEVHWIESDRPPTGAGEPPYPPLPPAVGNAVFAAAGIRLRDLPLQSPANRTRLRGSDR